MSGRARRGWTGAPWQPLLPELADVALQPGSLPSLAEALAAIPEHRHPRGFKAAQPPYPLVPILLVLLVGLLCGQRGYAAIAAWAAVCARDHPEVWAALGFLPSDQPRTPVAATLFRLVRDVDQLALHQALEGWLRTVAEVLYGAGTPVAGLVVPADQVALDGKTVRGASARRAPLAPLHLVAAYVPALAHVLDQAETDGKGRELAAVHVLLGRLPLRGRVLTGDALLTQLEVCQTILDGGGDDLLPVKDNQPSLLDDLTEAFSPSGPAAGGGAAPVG
ncbi:MAG: ISAs1 family transposase [Chloroflexi bacterium]|nr:ISAs1 family transposase [Chloroflexota bacterium]